MNIICVIFIISNLCTCIFYTMSENIAKAVFVLYVGGADLARTPQHLTDVYKQGAFRFN